MSTLELWVKDGALVRRPVKADGTPVHDKILYDAYSMVRVESGPSGTALQWNMGSANWASLMFAANFVSACNAPFTIKFFNAGWFEEVLDSARAVASRVESLIFKSDIRFSQRVYLKNLMPKISDVPENLRAVLETGAIPDDDSIRCKVDFATGTSQVEHIGEQSMLGRVWGPLPISYPAMSGHSYDKIVSQPYFEVLKTGKMLYDQVLASMIMPDGERRWFTYHRIITPESGAEAASNRVRIACAQAPVDIVLI